MSDTQVVQEANRESVKTDTVNNRTDDEKCESVSDVADNDVLSDLAKEIEQLKASEDKVEGEEKFEADEGEEVEEEDAVDEAALKERDASLSKEEKEKLLAESRLQKTSGNDLFKAQEYTASCEEYTRALRTCPLECAEDRAVLFSNRAAAKAKLGFKELAIKDCTRAVALNPRYVRVILRRARLYEETDKLDEALEDVKKVVEIEPSHGEALGAVHRLSEKIAERNEKMKTEMLSKLKDLGNMVLRPFGLSTENFKMQQDPNSGGYSINFVQGGVNGK